MRRTIAIGIMCAALGATPLAAAVKVATYAGTLYSGFDTTGEFGMANTNLAGAQFVARYTYDTDIGDRYTDGATFDQISGGGTNQSPILAATLTIAGKTLNFSTNN